MHLRQTEIQNLGVPAIGDEDIGRLDIAVNDALGMRRVQRIGNFNREREQHLQFKWLATDAILQRHAFEAFHGDVGCSPAVADFVDSADIRMVQR